MKKQITPITIYSICHFIVDFVCAIVILAKIPQIASSNNDVVMAIIVYNFFAFAFQVPLGCLLDIFKQYKYIAMVGLGLIGLGYVIGINNAYILATLVGIGNALFHLEGGVNIYKISKRKAFLNGLFVAPGAMGIFLGTTFYNELIDTFLPLALIVLAICLLSFIQKNEYVEMKDSRESNKSSLLVIVLLIGLSIIVRSIGGSAIVYTWKTGFVMGFVYTIAIVLGKAFGGLIADKLGLCRVALISLGCSVICLLLGFNIHVLAYIGIFLFNVPMSITLVILENSLSKNIAYAVGLNTMFLFIGFLISFIDITINNSYILIASIIIAMLSIYFAYNNYMKGEKRIEKD